MTYGQRRNIPGSRVLRSTRDVSNVGHMGTDLVTTAELAQTWGVSVRTIARWVEAGKITPAARGRGPRGALLFRADTARPGVEPS